MSQFMHVNTTTNYVLPMAIFVVAFMFLVATVQRAVNPYDEGLILFGATRVLSGDTIYRDFYAIYGPAQFYVLAALFKLFGSSVLVERIWDLLLRASIVVVVYLIVSSAWTRKRAILVAALTCLWLSYFENYGYPVFPCLLFSLLSVYCLVSIHWGQERRALLFAAGVCAGITILFRHDVGIATIAAGMVVLGLFHFVRGRGRETNAFVRSATFYLAGAALPVVPTFLLLLSAGAAHDMLAELVLIPASTYVRMRSLPFPSVAVMVHDITHLKLRQNDQTPAVYLPIFGVVCGVARVVRLWKDQRSAASVVEGGVTSQRVWVLVHLTLFTILFFFKGWVRPTATQMALAIVPSLVILGTSHFRFRYSIINVISAVGIASVVIVSMAPIWNSLARVAQNLVWAFNINVPSTGFLASLRTGDYGRCSPSTGLERIRCFYFPEEQLRAVVYVEQHTRRNEPIFVGLSRHDKTPGNDILFYFLAKRPSATKWHQFDPGLQSTAPIQLRIVSELSRLWPRYVILSPIRSLDEEPNESARSSGVTILDQFIHRNYCAVASFGELTILQHCSRLSAHLKG